MNDDDMKRNDPDRAEGPRTMQDFSLRLPERAMRSLQRVATYRDISCEALAREYIGCGLRDDLARYFDEQVLNLVDEAIRSRFGSESADEIMEDVRRHLQDEPVRTRTTTDG